MKKLFTYISIIVLIFIQQTIFSQVSPVFLESHSRNLDKQANNADSVTFSAIRTKYCFQKDKQALVNFIFYKSKDTTKHRFLILSLDPIYELFGGLNVSEMKNLDSKTNIPYFANFGFSSNLNYSDKVSIGLSLRYGLFNLPDYLQSSNSISHLTDHYYIDGTLIPYNVNNSILNSFGFFNKKNDYLNTVLKGSYHITYQPYTFLKLELARGENFIGDGYRSLMLSENSLTYPHFKIETEFLFLKYSCIWTKISTTTQDIDWQVNHNKYSVFHYLDVAIGKKVNLGFFESVVSKDLNLDYFIPVIFFRPVEFSMGGDDNAIIGVNLKYNFYKNYALYSQFVIDDMVVGQFFNDIKHKLNKNYSGQWGWFANKWAFQFGFKSFDLFKIKNLDFFTEINIVRPYMYSHSSVAENYTNYGQALAHPLGANFVEWIGGAKYQISNFGFNIKSMYAVTGLDENNSQHFGQNILKPTIDANQGHNIAVSSYDNYLLQGLKTTIICNQFEFSYLIKKNRNLAITLNFLNRITKNSNEKTSQNYIMLGFRSNISKFEILY
ncbi:MAG: hypothetical protein LBV69_03830 [Bacteroidales bacterium]|jgi:hypothetical protein|nr:hypothetical protein [Bacteroidales bacterium]